MNKINFIQAETAVHFTFDIKNFPNDLLQVRKFYSSDDGLMTDTEFSIEVLSKTSLSINSLISQEACLHFFWFNQDIYHRGIISQAHYQGQRQSYYLYSLQLASLLHPLQLTWNNRIFNQQHPLDIAKQMILSLKQPSLHWQQNFPTPTTVPNRIVQYQESDWEFIRRILSEHNMGFIWQHQAQESTLLLFNDLRNLPHLPKQHHIPYLSLSNQSRDEESVWLWQERCQPNNTNYLAESDCMGFAPGLSFSLEEHPESEYNRDYRILSVRHFGQQSTPIDSQKSQTELHYKNHICCIAADHAYKIPLTPAPIPNTLFTGKILANNDALPQLNYQGDYQVKFDFDNAEPGKFKQTVPLRKLHSYLSQGAGLHFPLRNGTEILASFIDDLNSEAIILGAVPNLQSPSPVQKYNARQHLLKTQLGHTLCLDDTPENIQLTLTTAQNRNRLVMESQRIAKEYLDKIELVSEQGALQLKAHKNLSHEALGHHQQKISGKQQINIQGNQLIHSSQADIIHKSGDEIHQQANKHFLIHSQKSTLRLRAKQNLELKAKKAIQIQAQKIAELRSHKGAIKFHSAGKLLVETSNSALILQGGRNSINYSAEGKTLLKAKSILLKANKITIYSNASAHNNLPN